jgi:hypothetical protein
VVPRPQSSAPTRSWLCCVTSDGIRTALVDSCVLLDVATDDPVWADRSAQTLALARDEGRVVINPIVYAEVSMGYDAWRHSTPPYLSRTSSVSRFRLPPVSLPAKLSWPTGPVVVNAVHPSRTSTSVLTQPSTHTN